MKDEKYREAARTAKAQRNRAHYLQSASTHEHALLRFGPGDLAIFDGACAAAGLSRSAFARIYLVPLMAVLADKLPAIDGAKRKRNQSLATFLSDAIDASASKALAPDDDATRAGIEFDALFGAPDL
ncbi:MAG: hypothetical protein V4508_08805 [Pseudomonadota bacterium]